MDGTDSLREFIINDLHWEGQKETLTPDYPLIENQVVDSMGLFMLVSFVEQAFGVTINDAELIPENFGTIGAMMQLVERKQAAPA